MKKYNYPGVCQTKPLKNGGYQLCEPCGDIFYYDKTHLLHREDGPAAILSIGDSVWAWHGTLLPCTNQEEFERLMKLKAFW